jgi:DeoR family transcriptional regulator, aga operon transcriptional repressor
MKGGLVVTRQKQLGSERRQILLKFLRTHGSASVATICDLVGASPATVHRDLELLAGKGLLQRVHGGALSMEDADDPPVSVQRLKAVPAKRAIAAAALDRIRHSDNSIFVEASTTTAHMTPSLREMSEKVFVTNSPEIALDLVGGTAEVLLIGGNLRPRTLAAVGPLAMEALERVSIDLAFIGVSAIDGSGISNMNMIEAETKSMIISKATRVVALADGEKLGARSLVPVAPLSALHELVTDSSAPSAVVDMLREQGVQVTIAHSKTTAVAEGAHP